jgi:DNA-binding transcriptional MerR regulator
VQVWLIGGFAAEIERSIDTVRRLERLGVIKPQRVAGKRIFTLAERRAALAHLTRPRRTLTARAVG